VDQGPGRRRQCRGRPVRRQARPDQRRTISYDVGGLYYWYPSNDLNPNANTFELYGQVGYGPAYIKYSHSTTNLFGTADSKQSGYLDLGANVPLTVRKGWC
jgi:uncharacterized protein (TIGR02001 family)